MSKPASKLDSLFCPKSIAVVGASTRPGTAGNDILRNLLFAQLNGSVYPVNPKADSVFGVHCYPTLSDIPYEVEQAIIIIPAKAVLGAIDQAIAKGVKSVVVISAGFKEIGGEGAKIEAQLRDKVRAAGISLIGPNCLGVINTDPEVRMNGAFGKKMPAEGNLAFVSQSGALCASVLDYAEQRGIGFSKFISFGNKADVNEVDLLEYLATDDKTAVITMYLEDITDGPRFIQKVREISWNTRKPILCLKSGRSPEGAKAVSSHTGSLAGSDKVYDALFQQAGVQRVDTISELFDFAAFYTTQPLPRGKRVAIITNAGGPGIMTTDAIVNNGLKLAQLTDATKDKLRQALPPTASVRNPVDVIGDARADRYQAAVRTVLEDDNVDCGVIILTPQSMTEPVATAAIIPDAIKGINKPVICSFMGARDVAGGVEILRKANIPDYTIPEDGVKSLAAAASLVDSLELDDRQTPEFKDVDVAGAKRIIADLLGNEEKRYLTQSDCRPLFAAYRLPLLRSGTARNADEAAKLVESFGVPVVMKVMSADVVHKYDAGGVLLNIAGPDAARQGYQKILTNVEKAVPGAKVEGILIEEMARKGVEVILGSNRDDRFGPLMMFGLGGTLVEVLKDVSFRLAPMWRVSAERMIRQIRSFKVLDGFRGNPPADIDAIVDTLLRLSAMMCNHPEISECDINPLIVHAKGEGCSVADSRIMLRRVK
ncbi:MAG: acetate--CoA ligase family protein [Planctomycetaceae bacterium]|nr:acetate--CoA ligase family protein [Planctomycetaceae bacterium]